MRMLLSRVTFTRSSGGWFCFWAAALLVLPHCALQHATTARPATNVIRGDTPRSSAIFCDIEKPPPGWTSMMGDPVRRCATADEVREGIRLKEAAVALVAGDTSTIGLDDSPEAMRRCAGMPAVVEFQGPFPRGSDVCLNCDSAIGPAMTQHSTTTAVCRALCLDLFSASDANVPASSDAAAFCTTARARLSTNFPTSGCYNGVCDMMGGMLNPFDDPRKHPEPVNWINLNGVNAVGGTLTRTAPTTGFSDAGASSSLPQLINGGDAYVEFTATEITTARTVGLSSGPPPMGGITFNNIDVGLLLLLDQIVVVENGPAVTSFVNYAPNTKFRVKLRDHFDNSATISVVRLTASCEDGSPCPEAMIYTSPTRRMYPFRVDAMFREQGGTVTNARIVRIR